MTDTKHDYVNCLLDDMEKLLKQKTFPNDDDIVELDLMLERLSNCLYDIDAYNYYWLRHCAYRIVHRHLAESKTALHISVWRKFHCLLGYIETYLNAKH